jgi:hypothetical protein
MTVTPLAKRPMMSRNSSELREWRSVSVWVLIAALSCLSR